MINKIKQNHYQILFVLVFLIGIFARVWEFGVLPPGLQQDEVSSGVDAFSLYHFGIDRNGVSYPVHFISWGNGQNALYAYMLIPFIAFGGLSSFTVRIPMLLAGILTLPLVYFVAKRTLGENYALLSMFFVSISPWHIILSRWGLESNFLPFIFMAGYASLLKSKDSVFWFVLANVLFALSLYAYSTAFVAVPLFLACTLPIILRSGMIKMKWVFIGIIAFILLALPIGLFISINMFQLNTIHLGNITIPRLPTQPRYEHIQTFFKENPLQVMWNFLFMLNLLITQTDHLAQNTVDPYGYFYSITFPLAIAGVVQLILLYKTTKKIEYWFLISWTLASLAIGLFYPVNINRINLIFIPLLLEMTIPVMWLRKRFKFLQMMIIFALFVGFIFFMLDYHGAEYRTQAAKSFFPGLLDALNFVKKMNNHPICVTDKVNMPYIYVLFSEQINPRDYLDDTKYGDSPLGFRRVLSLGRYKFGVQNCSNDPNTIYVLEKGEIPPIDKPYETINFDNFNIFRLPPTSPD